MFSLNFSSAGKGSFMAGEAKNMHQRHTFLGGGGGGGGGGREGGSGVKDKASTLLWNLGAKFSEMLFPHFKTYFMQISHCYL